ncbi:YggN family protein [Paraglaciecola polaris]|uniref:DUF2884 family protein n=1 Tax=Paraglaciecola polaris LMG 21857 TaxID=1129793 RepID=K6ZFP9_9ALTE|nr:YggN family protein [Paraglaciecola polaris]GAC34836.1 hypothetical protein GPLA_3957 [Paraglaciecola polaris LMG 21857]
MRNIIFCTSLMLCSAAVAADKQCDVEFNGGLQLENQVLTLTTEQNDKIVINQSKHLYVNGQKTSLSASQQARLNEFYDGISSAVPVAANIAADAIELANYALDETFTQLLGENNSVVADISAQLQELKRELNDSFYADDGSIRLNSAHHNQGEFLSEGFEIKFEQAIETIVAHSIGQIMVTIGSELIFNGGDLDEFEQRMENFAVNIERQVENQSEALEARAEVLCASLANIDRLEEKLQNEVPQLADMDILQVKHYAM